MNNYINVNYVLNFNHYITVSTVFSYFEENPGGV